MGRFRWRVKITTETYPIYGTMTKTIIIQKERILEAIWALILSIVIMFLVAHAGTITYVKDYTPSAKNEINRAMHEYYQKEYYRKEANKARRIDPNKKKNEGEGRPFEQSVNAELARAADAPVFSFGPYVYGIVKGTWELNGFTTITIEYEHEKAKPRWGINEYEVNYLRRTRYYFLAVLYDWHYTCLLTIAIIVILWCLRNFKRNYNIVIR